LRIPDDVRILGTTEAVQSLTVQLRECLKMDLRALQSEAWKVVCAVEYTILDLCGI